MSEIGGRKVNEGSIVFVKAKNKKDIVESFRYDKKGNIIYYRVLEVEGGGTLIVSAASGERYRVRNEWLGIDTGSNGMNNFFEGTTVLVKKSSHWRKSRGEDKEGKPVRYVIKDIRKTSKGETRYICESSTGTASRFKPEDLDVLSHAESSKREPEAPIVERDPYEIEVGEYFSIHVDSRYAPDQRYGSNDNPRVFLCIDSDAKNVKGIANDGYKNKYSKTDICAPEFIDQKKRSPYHITSGDYVYVDDPEWENVVFTVNTVIDEDSVILDPDVEEELALVNLQCMYDFANMKAGEKEREKSQIYMPMSKVDFLKNSRKRKLTEAEREEMKAESSSTAPNKLESMEVMADVLRKVYDNPELRSSVVPLFIGNPGLGKTRIIEEFAKERGANLIELITSQMSPFEISGIAMPDKETKEMTYYNFDKIENMKDGDILFFDELLNGNPTVLNACLTILEQRTLISGKKLPDIMIVAAANPQGMVPLTPQIKERFLWYDVKFSRNMWQNYMLKKYGLPKFISKTLATMIEREELLDRNFMTPRSVDKAVQMILKDCPTPYSDAIEPSLNNLVRNAYLTTEVKVGETVLKPGETASWLSIQKSA